MSLDLLDEGCALQTEKLRCLALVVFHTFERLLDEVLLDAEQQGVHVQAVVGQENAGRGRIVACTGNLGR